MRTGRRHVGPALFLASLLSFGAVATPAAADVYLTIDGDNPTSGNCWPFGVSPNAGGAWGPHLAFIYKDIPPFDLKLGDVLAFDLVVPNDADIGLNIDLSATTANGGDIQSGFTSVVTNTQTASVPRGDGTTGNYELGFAAQSPFTFAGGGLIIRFSNPSATFATDQNCDADLRFAHASDTSGQFVKRAVNDADGIAPWPSTTTDGTGVFRLRLAPMLRTVSLGYDKPTKTFSGSIDSANDACQVGHDVTIWRRKTGPDVRVARATTDGDDDFSATLAKVKAGMYYATVPETVDGLTDCGSAKSKAVRVR